MQTSSGCNFRRTGCPLVAEGKRDAAIRLEQLGKTILLELVKVTFFVRIRPSFASKRTNIHSGSFVENTQVFAPGKGLNSCIGNCEIVQECPFSAVLF